MTENTRGAPEEIEKMIRDMDGKEITEKSAEANKSEIPEELGIWIFCSHWI